MEETGTFILFFFWMSYDKTNILMTEKWIFFFFKENYRWKPTFILIVNNLLLREVCEDYNKRINQLNFKSKVKVDIIIDGEHFLQNTSLPTTKLPRQNYSEKSKLNFDLNIINGSEIIRFIALRTKHYTFESRKLELLSSMSITDDLDEF